MTGAIEKAEELQREIPNSWIPQQFKNPSNPAIHAATTAREIVDDFSDGLDYLISGIGAEDI